MKNILLLLVVSFFGRKNCEAQNLVPNPSFEDTVQCPDNKTEINYSIGWTSYRSSPDYFNVCSDNLNNIVGIPVNSFGYQTAATGNAYSGINVFINKPGQDFLKEIIGRQLSSPLYIGTKYFSSIKVSLGDSSKFAVDKICISFSTTPFDANSNPVPINNQAIIYPQSIITDTTNWTIISGSFIADFAYDYIMVGNFFLDSLTNHVSVSSSSASNYIIAYYYVDDVCVSPDSLACDLNPEGIYNLKEAKASINLYPNPVSEQLTVEATVGSMQLAIGRIEIVDALGRILLSDAIPLRDGIARQIDIHSLSSNIYFIKVYFGDGSMEVRRFVKE